MTFYNISGKTLETLQDTTFSSGENLEGKTAIFYGHGFDYNGNLFLVKYLQ
jgi:hypothetical protein